MPPAGFEPPIPAGDRPQTLALDLSATLSLCSSLFTSVIVCYFVVLRFISMIHTSNEKLGRSKHRHAATSHHRHSVKYSAHLSPIFTRRFACASWKQASRCDVTAIDFSYSQVSWRPVVCVQARSRPCETGLRQILWNLSLTWPEYSLGGRGIVVLFPAGVEFLHCLCAGYGGHRAYWLMNIKRESCRDVELTIPIYYRCYERVELYLNCSIRIHRQLCQFTHFHY
jgi:hypothetical protein